MLSVRITLFARLPNSNFHSCRSFQQPSERSSVTLPRLENLVSLLSHLLLALSPFDQFSAMESHERTNLAICRLVTCENHILSPLEPTNVTSAKTSVLIYPYDDNSIQLEPPQTESDNTRVFFGPTLTTTQVGRSYPRFVPPDASLVQAHQQFRRNQDKQRLVRRVTLRFNVLVCGPLDSILIL